MVAAHVPSTFHVRPRYTEGIADRVSARIAAERTLAERAAYDARLAGARGDHARRAAERLGLGGIIEERKKTARGWDVVDLLTGARERWPYVAACPSCRARLRPCHRGRLPLHRAHGVPCAGGGTFAGERIEPAAIVSASPRLASARTVSTG